MKKVVLIFRLFFFFQFCSAQSDNIDSLLNVLHHLKKEDTAKLAVINKIALAYTSSDFTKGNQMADTAIELATRLKNKRGLANAYLYKGINQFFLGNYDTALNIFRRSLSLYQPLQDNEGMAQSLRFIGATYYQMSHPDTALKYDLLALKFAGYFGDQKTLGDVNNNIGNDYQTLSNISKSTDYYLHALKNYELSKNKIGMAGVNGNIGNTYIAAKEPEKGIKYLQNAYNLFKETGHKGGMSLAIHNIGVAYKDIGHNRNSMADHQKALKCFQQSLAIDKAIGSEAGVINNIDNIGQIYNELKDYDKAISNLKRSLQFYESQNIVTGIARDLTVLSYSILYAPDSVLIKNEISPSKRYAVALSYQRKAISFSKQAADFEEQAFEWQGLSLTYEKQKRYDSALLAYQKFHEMSDSAFNLEKGNELTRKTMQYDFDKKEALLKSQQQLAAAEISKQKLVKNFILAGAVFLLIASSVIFMFYKKRRDANQRQKEAEFMVQVSDTEMKALRLQMNPHFIFNSLNSIRDYMAENNLETADDYLTKFAKLMRSVLENSEEKEVNLADDLKALELYMQLESLRLNNKFTYEVKVDADIDKENTLIPPLILQPFVENSIWHGIAHKKGNGKIIINIKKEGDMLRCTVDDNGIGLKQGSNEAEKKSLGMKITASRINILNKTKKTNGSVSISKLDEGTRAEVRLPLQLSF